MALPAPSESALAPPRFAYRHSMIPRPANCGLRKEPEDLSPKSVIVDRRFVSPASSSSSSMDRHSTLPEATHLKSCGQPRHDRGYSISDGELSDPDSCMDSAGTSLELGKVGNSGPLESLPETHSLALEASNSNVGLAGETANAGHGLESSEGAAISSFSERSGDSARADLHRSTSAAFRGTKYSQARRHDDDASALPITRSNSDTPQSIVRGMQIPGSQCTVEDENDSNQLSEWSQPSTSCGSPSEKDGKGEEPSTRCYPLEPGSRSRRRDHPIASSRAATLNSAELLSTSGSIQAEETKSRARQVAVGPGAANNFGYPGPPLVRFSPSWSQAGNGNNNTISFSSASPRVEKGVGSFSPASSTDVPVGLRYPHRFLSGPIMGSMIPKPPPSKWDDAEKWIVSPGHSDQSPAQPHHRALATQLTGRRGSLPGAQSFRYSFGADSPDYATPPGEKPMSPHFESAFINAGKLESPTPTPPSSLKKRSKALSFGDLSRRFDPSRAAPAATGPFQHPSHPGHSRVAHHHDSALCRDDDRDANPKAHPLASNPRASPASSPQHARSRSLSLKETSKASPAPVFFPEPTSGSRDMGTQMTPAESLRNSTCTTPGLMASPTRHNTPARSGSRRASSLGAFPGGGGAVVEALELQSCHLAKLELRKLAGEGGGGLLDRNRVWATREEEERECAASLRGESGELGRGTNGAKAVAWEEAEQAKALARYTNKEAKIKAWEELQQAQAEAEMKKIEAKAEKILADANEKMRSRMAMAARKAADMRAAAEAVRKEQAAKAAEKADFIRQTGLLSPARSPFTFCFLA